MTNFNQFINVHPLFYMFSRWWSGGKCDGFKETSTSSTKELQLDNVAGVFVVVAMAALLALIACLIEYVWLTTKKKKKKVTHLYLLIVPFLFL